MHLSLPLVCLTYIFSALGGGSADPDMNVALATALKAARAAGVPKDNIDRALNKVCYRKQWVTLLGPNSYSRLVAAKGRAVSLSRTKRLLEAQ